MVKVEFGKRDFIWIGLIVVLFSFSFVYSYGGNNPNIMGHSGGEIELNGNTVVNDAFCQKITGKNCGSTVVALYCGDGSCNNGETCSSCSGDCGACYVAPYCGDGTCINQETCSNCVADCGTCSICGDGTCNGGETCSNCVADCGTCYVAPTCWSSGQALCWVGACGNGYTSCWSGGCADPPAGNCCSGRWSTTTTAPGGAYTAAGYNWCD